MKYMMAMDSKGISFPDRNNNVIPSHISNLKPHMHELAPNRHDLLQHH